MSRRGMIIAGSLLAGVGQGIAAQANAVRERALRQMEIDAQTMRQQNQQSFEAGQNTLNRQATSDNEDKRIGAQEFDTTAQIAGAQTREREGAVSREKVAGMEASTRRGLIASTFTNDQGEVMGMTAGGDVKPTGQKTIPKDLTAKQKLFIENAKTIATEEQSIPKDASDPEGPQQVVKVINPEKYAKALKASKDPAIMDLANMAVAANAPIEQGIAVDPDAPATAEVNPPGTQSATKPVGETLDKGAAYTEAPLDPADREVDKFYMAPNGKLGRWTKRGWQIVE